MEAVVAAPLQPTNRDAELKGQETMMKRCILSCLLLALGGAFGCETPTPTPRSKLSVYNEQDDADCELMAENYRLGRYNKVNLEAMIYYFERRIGKMTSADLKRLLGPPRVVTPKDGYYDYALAAVYGLDGFGDAESYRDDKHDQVLHYGENGPPEHWNGDESSNLFFILKNDVVIAVRGLFP